MVTRIIRCLFTPLIAEASRLALTYCPAATVHAFCFRSGHIEQKHQRSSTQQIPSQGQTKSPSEAEAEKNMTKGSAEAGQTSKKLAAPGAPGRNVDGASLLGASAEVEAEVEVDPDADEGEKEVRDEDVKQLYDDEAQMCSMPECPDPRLFVEGLNLRRYQRQALAWMIQRERRRYVTEEDCTGLSLLPDHKNGVMQGGSSDSGHGSTGTEDVETKEAVSVKDGVVHVTSWNSAQGDSGGSDKAVIHPLWERRAAACMTRPLSEKAAPPAPSLFLAASDEQRPGGDVAGRRRLLRPTPFFVNVYSRQFQQEFPPASLGCRGGILADEMGMGKVRV